MSEIVRLKKDEILFEKGEPSDEMYILRSGKLQIYDEDQDIGEIKAINMVGEISFLGKGVRHHSIKAIDPSTLVVITREHFEEVFTDLPDWYLALYRSVVKRLLQMGVGDFI